MKIKTLLFGLLSLVALSLSAQNNVAEEVAWVVGDEPIFKSDIIFVFKNISKKSFSVFNSGFCFLNGRIIIDREFDI